MSRSYSKDATTMYTVTVFSQNENEIFYETTAKRTFDTMRQRALVYNDIVELIREVMDRLPEGEVVRNVHVTGYPENDDEE